MQGHPDLEYLLTTQLYRPGRKDLDNEPADCGWDTPIEHLLAAGYTFIPGGYSRDGYLFRGMQSGLLAALNSDCFGWFDGTDEVCRVERAMGVWFFTSDVSDAVTISRLYQQPADAGILALRADLFHDCLEAGKAAVLAVGDGGMVFRYPLLTRPVTRAEVACIFTSRNFASAAAENQDDNNIVALAGTSRKELERELFSQLSTRGLSPASPVPYRSYPRRHHHRLKGVNET
jgi:hypothetical protein